LSLRRTKSSRVGGVWSVAAHRALNRCHRTLTGASTLTSRKKGRLRRASTTVSSHMSVVTNRSLHLSVTKSSSESMFGKVCCASTDDLTGEGTRVLEADFSSGGVSAVRARRRRVNWCSSTRYEAIDDLPAHIPVPCQPRLILFPTVLASAQSNKHSDRCRPNVL